MKFVTLSREEAQETLDYLNERFGTSCGLQFTRTTTGRYTWHSGIIRVGCYAWRGNYSVVHEFAHFLQERRGLKDRGHHGRHFYATLIDVAEVAHGNVKAYSWHSEYKTLWRWAVLDGYSETPLTRETARLHAHLREPGATSRVCK